jgi:peptidyl-tRNA hydrolase
VIGGFRKEEKELIENAVIKAAKAAETIIESGIEKAMAEYNVKLRQPGEEQGEE